MKYLAGSAFLVLLVAGCTALVPPLAWESWDTRVAEQPHAVPAPVPPAWLARWHAPVTAAPDALPASDVMARPRADASL